MDNKEKLVMRIEELLDEEIDTDNVQDKVRVIHKAIRLSEELVELAPKDGNSYYLLALSWYNFPHKSNVRSWHTSSNLLKALQIDPNHQYANQYLGYLYFDQDRLEEAKDRFDLTDHSFFQRTGENWRSIKAKELSLVCEIRLDTNGFDEAKLDTFISEYLDEYAQDKTTAEWPTELKQCAEWLFENGVDINNPLIFKIVTLSRDLGMTLWNRTLASYFGAKCQECRV